MWNRLLEQKPVSHEIDRGISDVESSSGSPNVVELGFVGDRNSPSMAIPTWNSLASTKNHGGRKWHVLRETCLQRHVSLVTTALRASWLLGAHYGTNF
ncbi:hypothetical protein L6452_38513 [Arctium lappa]|uniref:Uncharacterized protein n=1 Tax=Arctium lappa TaxID=4217 RepID=A0ACB8XQM5_ARCLA|nr:hypothetical protein L6452_38513 [Arctium lappa]